MAQSICSSICVTTPILQLITTNQPTTLCILKGFYEFRRKTKHFAAYYKMYSYLYNFDEPCHIRNHIGVGCVAISILGYSKYSFCHLSRILSLLKYFVPHKIMEFGITDKNSSTAYIVLYKWIDTGGWEFDRSHGASTSSPSHWQQVEEQAPKPVGWTMCFLLMTLVPVQKLCVNIYVYIYIYACTFLIRVLL